MQEDQVRIVKGVDGRLTGEAYVHIAGMRAKLRLALAKDRTLMPVSLCLLFLLPHVCSMLTSFSSPSPNPTCQLSDHTPSPCSAAGSSELDLFRHWFSWLCVLRLGQHSHWFLSTT